MAIIGIIFNVDPTRMLFQLFLDEGELLLHCAELTGVESPLPRDRRADTKPHSKYNWLPSGRLWRWAETNLRVGKFIPNDLSGYPFVFRLVESDVLR